MIYAQQRSPTRAVAGFLVVILLHIGIIYALASGLAYQAIEIVKGPVKVKILEEQKQDKPDTPPPPPPTLKPPPPPYIPPPDISIQTPAAATNAIAAVTHVAAPPPPPVEKHEEVIIPAVVDPAKGCRGKPAYPDVSQRLGETGTVILQFLIGPDGSVMETKVANSSGHPRLDEAARQGLASLCKFKPGSVDGKAEPTWSTLKYTWKLE